MTDAAENLLSASVPPIQLPACCLNGRRSENKKKRPDKNGGVLIGPRGGTNLFYKVRRRVLILVEGHIIA